MCKVVTWHIPACTAWLGLPARTVQQDEGGMNSTKVSAL